MFHGENQQVNEMLDNFRSMLLTPSVIFAIFLLVIILILSSQTIQMQKQLNSLRHELQMDEGQTDSLKDRLKKVEWQAIKQEEIN